MIIQVLTSYDMGALVDGRPNSALPAAHKPCNTGLFDRNLR